MVRDVVGACDIDGGQRVVDPSIERKLRGEAIDLARGLLGGLANRLVGMHALEQPRQVRRRLDVHRNPIELCERRCHAALAFRLDQLVQGALRGL
ncbi:MAG: hypothetical protein GWN29_00620 [Gammaproteobacteria bacterium]|nr:hypothetical protein [Gammaproteobacteria bacterium]